jgi:hypothetical protein
VVNIHSTEKLERSARIRHILQPRQGRLEVLTPQLAVGAIGRREAETGYPLRVIIDDEMDKLKRQEMQEGQIQIHAYTDHTYEYIQIHAYTDHFFLEH